jgi:hypothetical protein
MAFYCNVLFKNQAMRMSVFVPLIFRTKSVESSHSADLRSGRHCWVLLSLLLTVCTVSGCGGDEGLERFPVEGTVTVNGVPAERVVVLLHHLDESTPGNYRYPTAVTNAEGMFKISSIGEADGAVKGNYKVTFTWLSSAGLDSIDKFGGSVGDPKSSSFEVTVPIAEGQTTKFDLVVHEEQLRKPGHR